MGYREEAIECVRDSVLPMQKQLYEKHNGDFDKIYTEEYNNASYMRWLLPLGMSSIRLP